MICDICEGIFHADCSKSTFEYDQLKNCWHCQTCALNKIDRYNPFSKLSFDKYDPVHIEDTDDITEISKILLDCRYFDAAEFSNMLKTTPGNMSAIFNNIDGNATNFDSFIADIACLKHSFSFIGIAETNVSSSHGDLYSIPGYASIYNDKCTSKSKGS